MFIPRMEAPSKNDKYWIHNMHGGLNSCIKRDGNSVLPNCVGYAWGRAYEILGSKPSLSRGNANKWYTYNDGYKRSKEPVLGAIICWKHKSKDTGHVGVVEAINDDNSIIISNSNYSGKRFYLLELMPPYKLNDMIFQGFIDIMNEDFFGGKKYFSIGCKHKNIDRVANFLYNNYKEFTDKRALGSFYGKYISDAIKEFQVMAYADGVYDDEFDGCLGPKTLKALKYYGFK